MLSFEGFIQCVVSGGRAPHYAFLKVADDLGKGYGCSQIKCSRCVWNMPPLLPPNLTQDIEMAPPFYRSLPDGRMISAASFGCAAMWSKPYFDGTTANAVLDAAVTSGINYFDTGPSYGNGTGERRLAEFLKRQHGQILFSTKVGTTFDESGRMNRSFRIADLEKSFSNSLIRLSQPRVDILYLHGPKRAEMNDDVFEFFAREKKRGRIIWSGVNSFDHDVLAACVTNPIDAVMLQYNVADLSVEDLLPKFSQANKIVIAGTALAQAVYKLSTFVPTSPTSLWYLLRQIKKNPRFFVHGVKLNRRMKKVGTDGAEVAMRFVVHHPHIHSAIFSTTKVQHLIKNTNAAKNPLSGPQVRLLGGYADA
jgi:aryl-alcohol dehydrogenase-like predicted oxidoreductase